MKKLIKDLKSGDIFLDSFGLPLKVEKIITLETIVVPYTKVYFITGNGNRMFMNFRSEREVKIIKE